ncbi:MAG: hypothetical protein IJZ20_05105 [Clostridia bacterium]|nr:hypothetical protein [Clostridia bacterium]
MSVYTTYAEAFNKETVFIKHDSDEYSVYTGGKEATEIDAEVYNFIWANKNGKFYFGADYNSEDDVYSLAKFDGKKVVTIAEDVKRAVIVNDSIIYYINEDDELVLNTGKSGKDTVVDEDVKSLVHPMSYVVVEEDAEADWFSLSMVGNDW